MVQTPAQILAEFRQKLDDLKNKSLIISGEYYKAKEKVIHHVTICKLQHKPVNLNIISSYPKIHNYIQEITSIQDEIIKLRNHYQNLLYLQEKNANSVI